MHSHVLVIDCWDGAAKMARELGENVNTVNSWRRRGIPVRAWPDVVSAANKRGLSFITLDLLLSMRLKDMTRKGLHAKRTQPSQTIVNTRQNVCEQDHGGVL